MAEERPEHADVVAAAVAGTQHRLFVDLVGRADARRPVQAVLDVTVQADAADPDHPDLARVEIEEPGVARLVDGLRVDDIEPQPVVERQLVVHPPGVLRVVEVAPLSLARVRIRADVPAEVRHVADEEGRESKPARTRERGPVAAERQFARTVRIARHAQVVRAANVDAELEAVVAVELRQVADNLELLLVLIERAVAPVHAKTRPEFEGALFAGAVPVDEARRQAGAERAVGVEARNAGVRRGPRAEVERQHVDLVLEEPEAEVRQHRIGERAVDSDRETVVANVGYAAKADDLLTAPLTERRRAVAEEVPKAVTREGIQAVAEPAVDAHVDRVLLEGLRVGGHEVVARAVVPTRRVGPRNQRENILGLSREPPRRDDVVREV